MPLVIEGSDDLGKTTACKKLVDLVNSKYPEIPAFYAHMTRPSAGFNFSTDYAERMLKFAVQDRFHLGGVVYHNAIPNPALKWVEGQLLIRGSLIVLFINSDREAYRSQLETDRRDQMYNVEQMVKFNSAWIDVAHSAAIYKDYVIDIAEGWIKDSKIERLADEWVDRLVFHRKILGVR